MGYCIVKNIDEAKSDGQSDPDGRNGSESLESLSSGRRGVDLNKEVVGGPEDLVKERSDERISQAEFAKYVSSKLKNVDWIQKQKLKLKLSLIESQHQQEIDEDSQEEALLKKSHSQRPNSPSSSTSTHHSKPEDAQFPNLSPESPQSRPPSPSKPPVNPLPPPAVNSARPGQPLVPHLSLSNSKDLATVLKQPLTPKNISMSPFNSSKSKSKSEFLKFS